MGAIHTQEEVDHLALEHRTFLGCSLSLPLTKVSARGDYVTTTSGRAFDLLRKSCALLAERLHIAAQSHQLHGDPR